MSKTQQGDFPPPPPGMMLDELIPLGTEELQEQFSHYRGLQFEQDAKDKHYFTNLFEAAKRLVVLLGERDHDVFSLSDARIYEYFEAAGTIPLEQGEPRKFLEFLLQAKRYPRIEREIDDRIIKLIDENPGLDEHNFSGSEEDADFLQQVKAFVEQARYRSDINIAGKSISVDNSLAFYLKDIYYDELAGFVDLLGGIILQENAQKEAARGREELAKALIEAGDALKAVSDKLSMAGALLAPYIDNNVKRSQSEGLFDPEDVRRAKVGQFVHSYMLTYRMHNETGECGLYDLLDGLDYQHEVASDPDFEAMIVGLVDGLGLYSDEEPAVIEENINRKIGRDVWKFRE